MGMFNFGAKPSLFGNNSNCGTGGQSTSLFGHGNTLFGQGSHHDDVNHHTPTPPPVVPAHDDHHDAGHDCHGGNDHGGTTSNGTGFPAIPADTSGVTFYIDLNGDGVTDKTMSLPHAQGATSSGGQSLQQYYDKVVADLKVSDPGADPSKIVIKVSAYSPSQGQLDFHLTGHESQSNADNAHDHDHHGHDELPGDHSSNDHAHNDDHHGSNNDHADNDHAGNGHAGNDHAGNDHAGNDHAGNDHAGNDQHAGSGDHTGGHDDADFYQHLCSNESGSHGENAHDDHDDHHDDSHSDHGFMFC